MKINLIFQMLKPITCFLNAQEGNNCGEKADSPALDNVPSVFN